MVARAGRPVALTDVAKSLGMLPSTAHRHLASLCRAGFVEQAGPSGHYDLGPAAFEFSFASLRRLDTQKLWNEAKAKPPRVERRSYRPPCGHRTCSAGSGVP